MIEQGECIKQDFVYIATNPEQQDVNLNIPDAENSDCCVEACVFASGNNDPFENDRSSVLWVYGAGFTSVSLILQKWNGGDWEDVAILNDNSLGDYTPFDTFTQGTRLVAYYLDWSLTQDAHGNGSYRVKTLENTFLGDQISQYSQSWCLMTYSPYLANGSVKIEWVNTHLICGLENGTLNYDFQDARISGQIRLKESFFGLDNSTYERNFVKYQNKQKVWIQDDEQENYILTTGKLTESQHDYLKNFVLKGDEIKITDYNSNNARTHIQTRVLFDGEYSPIYVEGSKQSRIELNFRNEFSIERKRC